MATKIRDQRIVTVSVSQAEITTLIVAPAKAAGMIDFNPERIDIHETDPETGDFEIVFSKEGV